MANVTLTTALNHDDAGALGLANGDDYIINGGALTINSDVRWGQNAAFPGNLTGSATLGGSITLDATETWWMAYDGPTGNVPALGTQGVQNCTGGTSGATGEFLGIFTGLGVAPTAAAAAIPATGFIKFRSKVGTFQDNETVTLPGGATIVVNSTTGGQRGWIHVVGEEASTITVPRLVSFDAIGDWFELGTTNGADDQTFQFPVTDACPAIQIETASGSGVYEWYLNAGNKWGTATQLISTDVRGKYFGMVNSTGVITIARRSSNSCGYKPVTGCKVRIPNIIISSSTTAAPTTNSISNTVATRWDFTTTAAGDIDIRNVCGNWYMSLTSAFSVNIEDSCYLETALISNTASTTVLDNVACGLNAAQASDILTLSNLFSGISITDYNGARQSHTGSTTSSMTLADCQGITLTRVKVNEHGAAAAVARGATVLGGGAIRMDRCGTITMTDCELIGSQLYMATCTDVTITNQKHADIHVGNTTSTNPAYGMRFSLNCDNVVVDGYSAFGSLSNVPAYSGNFLIENCSNVEIKNIGTAAAPYDNNNLGGTVITSTVSTDIIAKRVYTQNNRSALYSFANTVQGITLDNVWGDAGDSQAIAGLNVNPRGQRFTNSVTGQSSVYGRHWEDAFTSTTAGRIVIAMNEPLAATADQVTIVAGTPAFTSSGNIVMPTLNDEVIWEMPSFVIGHTAFASAVPTVTGTNTTNFLLQYAIDTGSGYSAFKNLAYLRTGAGGSGGSTNVTMTSTTGVDVNDRVYGTGIGVGAKVVSITDATTIVVSVVNTGAVSGTLTFNALPEETIPAFVDLYDQGGFRLKVRAVATTASTTNALTYIRIDTVTTSTEQQRQYPYLLPEVGYTGTLTGSNMEIYADSTDQYLRGATDDSGTTSVEVPWEANITALVRLRKPGYAFEEVTQTIDLDGFLIPVTQEDYSTIADTDPGALGITVTDHGASPVTWNSKNWSITITTTNDALTAAQVANFINYYTSQTAAFNGYSGLAWPEMIIPDGSNFQTQRGRLIGSAGATNKGVRVVRSDGTTAVLGFSQMMADDGTYYVLPVVSNVSVSGFITGSRVYVKNVTTNTVLHNDIIVGTSYSDSYVDGTDYTDGDTFLVRITYVNGATAKEPFSSTGTVGATGFSVSASQVDWAEYITVGIAGDTVTECTTDYASIQVDIDDPDNTTTKDRIAAFIVYAMHNEAQGIEDWFGVISYRSSGSALIDSSIASVKIDNVKTGVALNVIDSFQLRMDDGSSLVDTSTNTIRWDNSAEVVVVETGTSGLTVGEAAQLAMIEDTLTEDNFLALK
jgi:hypothetical protein